MLYIRHRINSISDLKLVPYNMGIELDLRDKNNKLILQHDPFKDGELFEDLLKEYRHSIIVLNVKSEGIEEEILILLEKYNINNYFFLDLSFPSVIKLVKKKENKIAIRFSEFEPIEQALKLKNMVEWVWLDCFNELQLNHDSYTSLKKYFKICLVSPELQNHPIEYIQKFKKITLGLNLDAICTKVPHLWET